MIIKFRMILLDERLCHYELCSEVVFDQLFLVKILVENISFRVTLRDMRCDIFIVAKYGLLMF